MFKKAVLRDAMSCVINMFDSLAYCGGVASTAWFLLAAGRGWGGVLTRRKRRTQPGHIAGVNRK